MTTRKRTIPSLDESSDNSSPAVEIVLIFATKKINVKDERLNLNSHCVRHEPL